MFGRLIIGHGMQLDTKALSDAWEDDDHPKFDTQSHYGRVNLGRLAETYLDDAFDFHNPVDDARATMLLYLRVNPYNGRTGFKDVFKRNDDDFPSL